jgi:acyl phosphate:glycerol-3-phosphate acyltransferase
MNTALLVVLAYLLGSLPTGYWLVKALKNIDLRQVGSGSTGTTNVLRTAGKGAAAFVFFVDIAKGFVPVWLAVYGCQHGWFPEYGVNDALRSWVAVPVGLAALIGHSKSIFLSFQGGKSAATGCGTLIGCNALGGLSTFGVWLIVLFAFRIVSAASIAAGAACGLLMWYFSHTLSLSVYAGMGGLYVIVRHKDNIKRLLSGKEPRIGQKLEGAGAATAEQRADVSNGQQASVSEPKH